MRSRLLSAAGLLIALLLMTAGLAQAQGKTLYWDRWDVDITIRPDGTFRVVEQQTIEFTSGTFQFGTRGIETSRLDRISEVEVSEGDRSFRESDSQEPWTFTTYMDGSEFKIQWFFPPTSDSRHTYTITYTVSGGLRYYPDGDQLWWKAVVSKRSFPVYASQVTVRVPEPAEIQNWDAYGTPARAQKLDARTVVFEAAEEIPAGQEFEVRVQFTPGVVAGQPSAWQAQADSEAAAQERQARWRPVINLTMLALGLLFLLGGPAVLYLLWYTHGRDRPVKLPADYLIEPPSDIPAGMAGTLLDERADMEDIIATIVDLARRGVITIEEVEEPGPLGIGAHKDFIYRLQGPREGLLPYEQTLIQEFFGNQAERRLSELKNKFYTAIPKIQSQLYQEVVQAGYFKANPESVRGLYAGLGIAGLIASAMLGMFLIGALASYADFAFCPSVGLGATFLGLIVLARAMPRKTAEGSEAAARWRAFRRYLEHIEKYTNLEEAQEVFERYLPYAIAFGVEKEYVRKFAAVNAPAPTWYVPYPPQPVERPFMRPGGPQRDRVPGRASERPSLEGSEEGTPSLEGMTRGTFQGLEAMTSGLFTMLNSAATVLSSQPASSRGGWSGGGSSGGRGSGGGSAGFG
ncbi:MAG: DUF2207 domain-containing protein [Anaerolineae bacterium]|nr:DUF2207 domain-containing protein [Anaerolineae bacterium]MDW8098545.1 DUF2207 domain-containing protein [Anaerolineae bacterium]